ncbi:MAG: CgeB family protein [Armatimonadota bacterium]
MSGSMRIAFFGSSLVSAYWNGAATYYRGIIRALAERGYEITFYEPDAYDRQAHRDMPDPDWAVVAVWRNSPEAALQALEDARGSDIVIKCSGVGVFDALLEREVLRLRDDGASVVFWDVDAPATLDRLAADDSDPLRECIPQYDMILTYGGGDAVVAGYEAFGARQVEPIYNALDPLTHHPVPRDDRFRGDLGFLGNRLPDREERVEEFFLRPAARLPERRFLIGGSGWDDRPMPANVKFLGHVYTRDHNAFNCSPTAVLNINRESMARYGFSPPTRVFEAAGAGACLITDYWAGIDTFLTPGEECLVVRSGEELTELIDSLTPEDARAIGSAALERVLSEHTYADRVERLEALLDGC